MIKTYLGFIGPVRSGHTFIASLLSAHPKVAIALNTWAFKKVLKQGYTKQKLFDEILNECKNRTNMKLGGYDYLYTEDQRNVDNVEIIGCSAAGRNHASFFKEYDKFLDVIEIPTKYIFVRRNSSDIITSSHYMNKKSITKNIDQFIDTMYDTNIFAKNHDVFDFNIESFVMDPKKWMTKILDFLEIESTNEYIYFCKSKTFKEIKRSFNPDLWSDEELDRLYDFML